MVCFQGSPRALDCRIDGVCGAGDYPLPDLPREASRRRSAPEKSVQFGPCECGARVYCGEECQAQDWAAGHKLRCASRLRYRPVTPDASADPLDALAADVLAVLDDDLDDVDDI